jgi:hypothetical protein
LLVLPLLIKRRWKLVKKYIYIYIYTHTHTLTCNSTWQSRHHVPSSTALVKLFKYAFFHVQKTPLQTPDEASALNLIQSSKFLPAIKCAAGKWICGTVWAGTKHFKCNDSFYTTLQQNIYIFITWILDKLTKTNPTESLITHTTLKTRAFLVPLNKKEVTVPQHIWVNFNTCNKVAIIT